jgi:hypothetical protein
MKPPASVGMIFYFSAGRLCLGRRRGRHPISRPHRLQVVFVATACTPESWRLLRNSKRWSTGTGALQ